MSNGNATPSTTHPPEQKRSSNCPHTSWSFRNCCRSHIRPRGHTRSHLLHLSSQKHASPWPCWLSLRALSNKALQSSPDDTAPTHQHTLGNHFLPQPQHRLPPLSILQHSPSRETHLQNPTTINELRRNAPPTGRIAEKLPQAQLPLPHDNWSFPESSGRI